MYLLGMVVFTLSSLWCGLSPNVEMLIVARVVQGIGASLMDPANHVDYYAHVPAA